MSRRITWSLRRRRVALAYPVLCLIIIAVSAYSVPAESVSAGHITSKGRRLARVLDSLDVEQRWLPGDAVEWRTGEHDPAARPLKGHCSAFAAAACAALHVYILRPPDHDERLLANAQCGWLEEEGRRHGWRRTEDPLWAQGLANEGNIVVACYRNPDRTDPGHIAIVRPSLKAPEKIESDGPDVTQAGTRNFRKVAARIAFRHHARAWNRGEIVYYWYPSI